MTEVDETREEARRNTRARFEQWAKNPKCAANTLSAVHNVRMDEAAEAIGLEPSFGQSPFALARGNSFEWGLFADDASRLRAALERRGCLPEGSAGLLDLRLKMNGGASLISVDDALAATQAWLGDLSNGALAPASIVAGPMIRIPRGVILPEALLIIDAVTVVVHDGAPTLTVGEIKVFPDRGGYTDAHQLASARAQAGLYRHALEMAVDAGNWGQVLNISRDGFMVFTWPGSNQPSIRPGEELSYQAARAARGFDRLEEVAGLIVRDDDFSADAPQLVQRVLEADTDYSEACLDFCDLAPRCHKRHVEREHGVVLGEEAARLLGDTTLSRAVELMNGAVPGDDREADLQRNLEGL